ncbi:MAG: carboxypeptidase regulatory-like domain-containing protein [Lewinellaceae bacterium]|nr:carboxypeptidase regulatory-like domain-containing protein [Lewinellaceae bacterium]
MAIRTLLTLICWLFLLHHSLAQDGRRRILGRVLGEQGEPLAGATITAGNSEQRHSDSTGRFLYETRRLDEPLVIRRLGYFPQRIRLDTLPFENGLARLDVYMVSNDISLPEVAISGKPVETIFRETYSSSLLDYGFAGKDLLLLVREGRRFVLRLSTDQGKVLDELPLPDDDIRLLHQSCMGNFHLVGADWAWEVAFAGSRLDTLPRYEARRFHHLVEPCVLARDGYFIFRRGGPYRQSVRYDYFDPSNRRRHLATIRDENVERDLRRRYDAILAAYMKTIPDVDRDDILDGKTRFTDPDQMLNPETLTKMAETNGLVTAIGFFSTLAADSVYAPLFGVGGHIYLFDHVNDALFRYPDLEQAPQRTGLDYHRQPGWRKEMLADHSLGRIYGRFSDKKGLLLKEIDLETGQCRKTYQPTVAPYLADHFRLRNGYLYFIGQPNVNVPVRRLYKVNLFRYEK